MRLALVLDDDIPAVGSGFRIPDAAQRPAGAVRCWSGTELVRLGPKYATVRARSVGHKVKVPRAEWDCILAARANRAAATAAAAVSLEQRRGSGRRACRG